MIQLLSLRVMLRPFTAGLLLGPLALMSGCDDPPEDGPVGSLVVMIRGIPSERWPTVEKLTVRYFAVEVDHLDASGSSRRVRVDAQTRSIQIRNDLDSNEPHDALLGQFPVPVGAVTGIRIFSLLAEVTLRDGSTATISADHGWLPSWASSGWKLQLAEGQQIAINEDAFSGLRADFEFGSRMMFVSHSWKVRPTVPAVEFQVHPEADAPGPRFDQATLVLARGTPISRAHDLAAMVSARVIRVGALSNWHRLKLSSKINIEQVRDILRNEPDVVAVGPGLNLGSDLETTNDVNFAHHAVARVHHAWDIAFAQTGQIGSARFPVAVVEGAGMDIAHPAIYRNIFVNQGELPLGLFDTDGDGAISAEEIGQHDFDPPAQPDGLITIRDLEAQPENSPLRPPDFNQNGRLDCMDLIADPRWADGIDGDPPPSGAEDALLDDLCGWDFGSGDNNPSRDLSDAYDPGGGGGGGGGCPDCPPFEHATAVAGILGGEGGVGEGQAGILWRTAIVPIKASIAKDVVPTEAISDAIVYVNRLRIPIANISQSWSFITKNGKPKQGCAMDLWQGKVSMVDSASTIATMRVEANQAWEALADGTQTLLVLSAGNWGGDLDSSEVLTVPAPSLLAAAPNRVLIVGNATNTLSKGISNFGSAVEIWAPANEIYVLTSSSPTSGTSAAAPFVSGVLALRGSLAPEQFEPGTFKQLLIGTTTHQVESGCFSPNVPAPFLDAEAFLAAGGP